MAGCGFSKNVQNVQNVKETKMAKSMIAKQEKLKSKYPSSCGSHKTMVDEDATSKLSDSEREVKDDDGNVIDEKVVLSDDHGTYTTFNSRLDSGLADPCRYTGRAEKY